MGFYSLLMRGCAKKILFVPPKVIMIGWTNSFFIKTTVIPVAMTFKGAEESAKEQLSIPTSADGYRDLHPLPGKLLGERTLVAPAMSA
ncbi:hypothetical protein Hanom_Chr10g00880851 [Helianthus anomalus]